MSLVVSRPNRVHGPVGIVFASAFLTACAIASTASAARADSVSDFYKGRTLQVIVSAGPGGGYDLYARSIMRHMVRHIPGGPAVVVKNMQGGGGIIGTNFLYNVASRDGSVIGAVINTVPFQPLLGRAEAKFDAKKFIWLGSANSETGTIFVNQQSAVRAFNDFRERAVTVGASGAGSSTTLYYRLLNKVLGTKFKIILGYKGSQGGFLALERGEIEGYFSFWSSLKTSYASLLKEKKIRLIVQIGLERDPELPNIPLALDFAKTESQRQAIELAAAPLSMGRPFLAPPGIPAARAEALQTAFMATMKDPKFVSEAGKERLLLTGLKSGDQILALINRVYKTPKDVVATVAALAVTKKKKKKK